MGSKTQMPSKAVQRSTEVDDAPPAYAHPSSSASASLLSNTNQTPTLAPSNQVPHRHTHTLPEEQAKQSLAQYGNPYATNPTWSPSDRDARLRKLPSLAFTMRLQQRFARKAGDIFNPPCPSMQRPIPSNTTIKETYFEPFQCVGKGDLASDGFKSIFMGSIMAPRDISSADWFRFIQDLTVASRLSGTQEVLAGITPITKRLLLPGHLITKLIRYSVVRKREPLIFETVEEWNARFFATRGVDVFIHNGIERLTAREVGAAIPLLETKYWRNNGKAPQVVVDALSDSSSDEEEEIQSQGDVKIGTTSQEGSGIGSSRGEQRYEKRIQRRQRRRQRSNANEDNGSKMMMLAVAHCKAASEAGPAVLAQSILTEDTSTTLPTYEEQMQGQQARQRKGEKS